MEKAAVTHLIIHTAQLGSVLATDHTENPSHQAQVAYMLGETFIRKVNDYWGPVRMKISASKTVTANCECKMSPL
jgi:hypothetical protein